jgi:hypothetical protein
MSSLADIPELVGFFSYSRADDEDAKGALSGLRDRIQRELRGQLGRTRGAFRLWQDRSAIAEGRLWEEELRSAIAESVFFIPIVTPTAVRSHHCKLEFELFLSREAALGRRDLVFPILYIRVPELEDQRQWRQDPVLSVIGMRQYADWQNLRHVEVNSNEVAVNVERFCRSIFEALRLPWESPQERQERAEAAARERAAEVARQAAQAEQRAAESLRQQQEQAEEQARKRATEAARQAAQAEQRAAENLRQQREKAEEQARRHATEASQTRERAVAVQTSIKTEDKPLAESIAGNAAKADGSGESLFAPIVSAVFSGGMALGFPFVWWRGGNPLDEFSWGWGALVFVIGWSILLLIELAFVWMFVGNLVVAVKGVASILRKNRHGP